MCPVNGRGKRYLIGKLLIYKENISVYDRGDTPCYISRK